MEAVEWFKRVVTEHYADFKGRAGRAEFWYFVLVNLIISVVLALLGPYWWLTSPFRQFLKSFHYWSAQGFFLIRRLRSLGDVRRDVVPPR